MDLLAEGRTAEVFDLGDGRVLKLLRHGFPSGLLDVEAEKTAAVHAAGVPAPAVHERRLVDGRPGIVMDRIDGVSMVDRIRSAPWTAGRCGHRLAAVHTRVLEAAGTGLPDIKDRLAGAIDATDLPVRHRSVAKDALLRLPDGDRVLHGDFHPLNVIVDDDRMTVIDWVDASAGSPSADVARTTWLMSPVVIPIEQPARRIIQAVAGFVRRGYLRAPPPMADPAEVYGWRLPVVAARIAEGIPHEDDALRAEVARLVGTVRP